MNVKSIVLILVNLEQCRATRTVYIGNQTGFKEDTTDGFVSLLYQVNTGYLGWPPFAVLTVKWLLDTISVH